MKHHLIFVLIIVSLIALSGCSGFQTNNAMSPEQLQQVAKDKNASVVCATGTGPWGKVNTTYVNVDKSVVVSGSVTVDAECKVSFQNAPAAK